MPTTTFPSTTTALTPLQKFATADGGHYWRPTDPNPRSSSASVARFMKWAKLDLRDRLRQLGTEDGRLKMASIGGEQESGFEQAFSSLSYAFLRDKAPRLLDYIVGFQLVDRNEDNTKAVGVFGFKVGTQWLYAPVFFLNGDLKGHELLYIKKQDAFVPMKENWVNYIMSRKPHVLGERSPRDVFQLGALSPSIANLALPPGRGKYGADMQAGPIAPAPVSGAVPPAAPKPVPSPALRGGKAAYFDDWMTDLLPMLAACRQKSARFVFRDAQRQLGSRTLDVVKLAAHPLAAAVSGLPGLHLETFLSSDPRLVKAARAIADRYPLVGKGFRDFHGEDVFDRLDATCKRAAESLLAGPGISAAVKRAAGDEKVRLIVKDDVPVTKNLSDEEKLKALSNGYLLKDERTGEEHTRVYNTQVKAELSTPHESGLYEVLERPASFERMLVITHPWANDGRKRFCTVARVGDGPRAWLNAHPTAVQTRKVELREDFEKWFEGLDKGDSLTTDATYVALTRDGSGTCPFKVRQSYGDGRYKVDFFDSQDTTRGRRASGLPASAEEAGGPGVTASPWSDTNYVSTYGAILAVNARPDTKIRAASGDLLVPGDAKFLKLRSPPKPYSITDAPAAADCCGSCGSDGDTERPIAPGDLTDIQLLFREKTSAARLRVDAHEVHLKTDKTAAVRLPSHDAAVIHLVLRHGLSEPAAREVVKAADAAGQSKRAAEFLFKYADNYPFPGPGPGSPPFPPPQYGSEPMGYNAVNAIYPQEEEVPVPGMEANRTDPRIYDPFLNITPDPQTVGRAQTAAQEGQKEVFDTTMISGMLKAVRSESMVDKHLPDLMKALDRIGRILFTFFWHGEEFADRYGKADMPEMEDMLRNSFEAVGDLVLYLRESTVEPAEGVSQGPDIEEAARN